MEALEAMRARHSVRAFLDTPVPADTVTALLEAARWAPSGVNSQPWHVAVLTGNTQRRLGEAIIAARESGQPENPDYDYYPTEWFEPYKGRRRECGLALYGALRIRRDDKEARTEAWYRNYRFFGAPVGLLFLIERRLAKGSWLDMGMFIQNVMLAAIDHGLGTCPQASLAEYPDVVRQLLGLGDDLAVVCGMSLGYPDENAPVNRFRLERAPVETFTRWYD